MAINLKGRSFLTLEDFTPAEIRYLLDLGHDLKAKRRAGICDPTLQGKHIVLLFEKTSTRTRCSFEVAATQEGGHVTYLDAGSSQMGKKESLEDTAKVLGRFFDGIEYRGYDQKVVEDLAKYAGVPVWNGLTDADHPTQILADMMTIEEHCHKPLNQVKVVFPGDVRNNMVLLTKSRSAPPCQQKKTPTGVIRRILSFASGSMRSPTRGSGLPLPLSLVAKRALSCARASARKTSPRTRPAAALAPPGIPGWSGAPGCAVGLPRSS